MGALIRGDINNGGRVVATASGVGLLPPGTALLTSRLLTQDDYAFNPAATWRTIDVSGGGSGMAMRGEAFNHAYGFQNTFIDTSHKEIVCSLLAMQSGVGLVIPLDASDIISVQFGLRSIQNVLSIVAATNMEIVPVTTTEGFNTHCIKGNLLAEFNGSINELEFTLYVGARPNRDNTGASITPTQDGMVVNGMHIRQIAGDTSLTVVDWRINSNAATNTFVVGHRHEVLFNTPLVSDGTVHLNMMLSSIFTDFLPVAGVPADTIYRIKYMINANLIPGVPATISTGANIEMTHDGQLMLQQAAMGTVNICITHDRMLIDSGLADLRGGGYGEIPTLVRQMDFELDMIRFEVTNRVTI